MHILEPKNNDFIELKDVQNAVMIMPGLAFDKKGGRAGYGKGFYDRYISRGFDGTKIAVTIDENIFEHIETDEKDIKYDILLSDKEVYYL